jgi:hypothetical protein
MLIRIDAAGMLSDLAPDDENDVVSDRCKCERSVRNEVAARHRDALVRRAS